MSVSQTNAERLGLLGGILKRVNNFDMITFDGRLIFQKTIYFLQVFKIYLGYQFSLYIRGPYSPQATKDGFELKNKIKSIPEVRFSDKEMEQNFSEFLSFFEPLKDKPSDLEVISSLHLFKQLFPKNDKEAIIKILLEKKPYLEKKTCESSWGVLEKFNLV